jgi:hypothetical protein
MDDLIEKADYMLYRAKKLGKNKICVAHQIHGLWLACHGGALNFYGQEKSLSLRSLRERQNPSNSRSFERFNVISVL